MAGATFGKIARSDWLLCGQESSYLGPLQQSVRKVTDRQITNVNQRTLSQERKIEQEQKKQKQKQTQKTKEL